MANEWLDKAKAAAMSVAKDAAEAAKNANLGEIMDKTKAMAMQAGEEAKKAADSIMAKKESTAATAPKADNALQTCSACLAKIDSSMLEIKDLLKSKPDNALEGCNERLAKIESSIAEIKSLLAKQ